MSTPARSRPALAPSRADLGLARLGSRRPPLAVRPPRSRSVRDRVRAVVPRASAPRAARGSPPPPPRPAFASNPETYAGDANLWATQELPRLLATTPKRSRSRDGGLVLTRGSWSAERPDASTLRLRGRMAFHNVTDGAHDVFVTEVTPSVQLLSATADPSATLVAAVRRASRHPRDDPPPRPDGYWPAYIVPVRGHTEMDVQIDITGFGASAEEDRAALATLDAAWLRVEYVTYGPRGRRAREQRVVLPLKFPDPTRWRADEDEDEDEAEAEASRAADGGEAGEGDGFAKRGVSGGGEDVEGGSSRGSGPREESSSSGPRWRTVYPGLRVLCVPTHLLCHLDDPVSVVKRYCGRLLKPGDVVAIGETPLAAMQGRTRHPSAIEPGFVARVACRLFNRFSSLATACGAQALVDLVGAWRVALAAVAGVLARLVGARGVFYRVAGRQANLVDDVSGQIPPYDQMVTLGPVDAARTCAAVRERAGAPCAIVDVNDLSATRGEMLILAKSEGVDERVLRAALLGNPQGNGDEQTPVVVVRQDPRRVRETLDAAEKEERERRRRVKAGEVKITQK